MVRPTACCLALVFVALASAMPRVSDDQLALDLDRKTGAYKLLVQGIPWLQSGDTGFTENGVTYSSGAGNLEISSTTDSTGVDATGAFTATEIVYKTPNSNQMITRFKSYSGLLGRGGAVSFEQMYVHGVNGTSNNMSAPYSARNEVSSMFPSFKPAVDGLGYLAFTGDMTGSNYVHGTNFSAIPTGVKGTGPLCLFTKDLSAAVVVSSFSQFMAASSAHVGGALSYGAQGSITAFPAEYSLSFIVTMADVSSSGVASVSGAFELWGDILLRQYGKSREVSYSDYGLKYLSYSTDNGAYYYYQTEGGPGGHRGPPYHPGKTYEQTLIDVKRYADSQGIPYRYILLDSWWYYQGVGGGVSNWVSRPDVFPHGNAYLRNATGWPIMGHNRYWAVDNVYAKQNGGQYDFVVEKKGEGDGFKDFSWPTEQRFWDDLMYNSSKWGLFMYEQDWLDDEYDNMQHLNTDATAARTWLLQMGSAAARNGLTIQYCMSHCRHIMQSIEIPAVTNARASGDYHAGNEQWQPLGTTGIFAWAVGIAPTKDNFWSTDVQTDSGYSDHSTIREPYNRLQSAVSTLSKGPVAPSDKIGNSDSALILKSCTRDGTLLQADKPAMAIDAQHVQAAFGCGDCGPQGELWAAYTVLPGSAPFAVLLGAQLKASYTLDLHQLSLQATEQSAWVAYEANSTTTLLELSPSGAANAIDFTACGKWDFQTWALAPVDAASGFALLGEQSKWVPVSAARFSELEHSVSTGRSGAAVTAKGIFREEIEVSWYHRLIDGFQTVVKCTVGESGTVRVSMEQSDGKFGGYCGGEQVY